MPCSSSSDEGKAEDGKHDDSDSEGLTLEDFVEENDLDIDLDDLESNEELDLSEKDLEDLPGCLRALADSCTELALEKNRLVSLPGWIGDFTNLVELYIRENRISALPDTIGSCTELDSIYCENNKLDSLPEEISTLEKLKGLTFQHNLFATVPTALLDCTALEELYFVDPANDNTGAAKEADEMGTPTALPCFGSSSGDTPSSPCPEPRSWNLRGRR